MPLDNVVFWVFAPIAVAAAVAMLLTRNVIYAALFLVANFGWKYLIPFGLFWVLATGAIVVLPDRYTQVVISFGSFNATKGAVIAVSSIVIVWLLGSFLKPVLDARDEEAT